MTNSEIPVAELPASVRLTVLGRINYEAYCATVAWKSPDGKPLPEWDALDPTIQIAWGVGALAVETRLDPDPPKREPARPSEALPEPVTEQPSRLAPRGDARNRTPDLHSGPDAEEDRPLPMADWRQYDSTAVCQVRTLVESALDRLRHTSVELQNAFDALLDLMTGECSADTERDAWDLQVLLGEADSELTGIEMKLRRVLHRRDDPTGSTVRRLDSVLRGDDGFLATALLSGQFRLRRPDEEPDRGDRE